MCICDWYRALRAAEVRGNLVTANLDTLDYPDLVAEIADLLLSYKAAKLVLCAGRYEGTAFLSLRNEPTQRRAGALMREVVGTTGAAGGHGTMAGARLFASVDTAESLQREFQQLVSRLCQSLGQPNDQIEPLLG